jgi:chitinase
MPFPRFNPGRPQPSRRLSGLLIIFALAVFRAGAWGAAGGSPPLPNGLTKVVVGYYPSWARGVFGHLRIEYANLSHVAHAFTWPDSEGNLIVPADYLYPELVETAHRNGVKVIMSIGGWGNCDGFPAMASRASTRRRFVDQVTAFCRVQGYDGVDLDWEFVTGPDESRDFSLLVRELAAALKAVEPPRQLTMAAPSDDYSGRWIDFEGLHPFFDYVGFMTYDYHGPWSGHSGHNAPLYSCDGDACGSVDRTFHYALGRGVPPEKLLLGVPFYGRTFDCRGLYQAFQTSGECTFAGAVEAWYDGWSYQWDDCAKVPVLLNPGGPGIICFDDPVSVAWKCAYVLDRQAGGVIVWELSQDGFLGMPVLIRVVGAIFRGGW